MVRLIDNSWPEVTVNAFVPRTKSSYVTSANIACIKVVCVRFSQPSCGIHSFFIMFKYAIVIACALVAAVVAQDLARGEYPL